MTDKNVVALAIAIIVVILIIVGFVLVQIPNKRRRRAIECNKSNRSKSVQESCSPKPCKTTLKTACKSKSKSRKFVRTIIDKLIGYAAGCEVFNPPSCLVVAPALQATAGADVFIYRGAAVEPGLAVNPCDPNNMVSAWQQNRISNGGAEFIGIAYTTDGGKCWKHSKAIFPPELIIERVSDLELSFSSDGLIVYMVVLLLNPTLILSNRFTQGGVGTFLSHDQGKTWFFSLVEGVPNLNYNPVPAGFPPTYPTDGPSPDKQNILADRFIPKAAYVVWDQFPFSVSFHSDAMFADTCDGGCKWYPTMIYNPFNDPGLVSNGIYNDVSVISCTLVQTTCGSLLNFMNRQSATPGATDDEYTGDGFTGTGPAYPFTQQELIMIRQLPNKTWTQTATIIVPSLPNPDIFSGGYVYEVPPPPGQITGGSGFLVSGLGVKVRSGDGPGGLMAAAINPTNNNLYVVFETIAFSPTTQLQQVGLMYSRDNGLTWQGPIRASQTPLTAYNPQAFTGSVAVTANKYVGVVYYDFRNDFLNYTPPATTNAATLTDAWLAIFKETPTGLVFIREERLTPQSFIVQNGPSTTIGVMAQGDYASIVAIPGADAFAISYAASLNGPFQPATQVYVDNTTTPPTTVSIDSNNRNQIFFSQVPVCLPRLGNC